MMLSFIDLESLCGSDSLVRVSPFNELVCVERVEISKNDKVVVLLKDGYNYSRTFLFSNFLDYGYRLYGQTFSLAKEFSS